VRPTGRNSGLVTRTRSAVYTHHLKMTNTETKTGTGIKTGGEVMFPAGLSPIKIKIVISGPPQKTGGKVMLPAGPSPIKNKNCYKWSPSKKQGKR
jgi:hypothetical protein